MKCDCCGRRKWLLESFAEVKTKTDTLLFCVDCNDIAYKVRDAAIEGNRSEYSKLLLEWKQRSKKPSVKFEKWQPTFLSPLDEKLKKYESAQASDGHMTTNEGNKNG